MLTIDSTPDGVLTLSPDGPLTEEDIRRLSSTFQSMTVDGRKVQGVVVHARRFPGWENMSVMRAHLDFARTHHRLVRRIAIASDSPLMRMMPRLLEWFARPQIALFKGDDLESASAWVRRKDD